MRWLSVALLLAAGLRVRAESFAADAPRAVWSEGADRGPALPDAPMPVEPDRPCRDARQRELRTLPGGRQEAICPEDLNPYDRFLNSKVPIPLSPQQKFKLAVHDVIDPFNILTITANAAITVGANAHSAYGPGLKGFGKDTMYSFSQDANGEFIGTFAIASLVHEDPHYHRLPDGTKRQRLVHAISRTVIAQHDDGTSMPNYETLLVYPISAELSNLYVPGVAGDGPSTVKRILIGYGTDPVGNIVTEFLPDFARRIHIRVLFVQRILNQVAVNSTQ
jgi:hypothetical protein